VPFANSPRRRYVNKTFGCDVNRPCGNLNLKSELVLCTNNTTKAFVITFSQSFVRPVLSTIDADWLMITQFGHGIEGGLAVWPLQVRRIV
jgi:hypothetical protein